MVGYEYFAVSRPADFVTHVEINRPAKLNAFIRPMWLELRTIFDHLSQDPETRAVVFSGAGDRAFTAGLDVQEASQNGPLADGGGTKDGARAAADIRRHIIEFQDCVNSIERCEKPVIVVLHGHSLGLAVDMSLCADIRVAARNTSLAVKEVDIGIAADIGTLTRLPKLVGSTSWVKEVCLTARPFGAQEALRVGLVSAVLDSKEQAVLEAMRLAGLMASKSPVAVQGTKDILNYSRDHPTDDGLRYTQVWNGAALQTSDVKAAIRAGMEKRKPRFEKL